MHVPGPVRVLAVRARQDGGPTAGRQAGAKDGVGARGAVPPGGRGKREVAHRCCGTAKTPGASAQRLVPAEKGKGRAPRARPRSGRHSPQKSAGSSRGSQRIRWMTASAVRSGGFLALAWSSASPLGCGGAGARGGAGGEAPKRQRPSRKKWRQAEAGIAGLRPDPARLRLGRRHRRRHDGRHSPAGSLLAGQPADGRRDIAGALAPALPAEAPRGLPLAGREARFLRAIWFCCGRPCRPIACGPAPPGLVASAARLPEGAGRPLGFAGAARLPRVRKRGSPLVRPENLDAPAP